MAVAGMQMWRLSRGGETNLGLFCTDAGLFLGRTPLIERRDGDYALRPLADLRRLLGAAFRDEADFDRLEPGLAVVKAALDEKNLCLAQIAAVRLRVPELPDLVTRGALEAEDRLIKTERGGDILARAGWDPAEHPRAGVPPNPGWFAPVGGSGGAGAIEIAQNEEDERGLEEFLDPLAELRQQQWDAAIARLREIDPHDPNLAYVANPGIAPSQEALDRLDDALEAAAIKRVTDKVMPNGVPIGVPGRGLDVQLLPGDSLKAQELFDYLRVGGTVLESGSRRTVVRLPGDAGFITYRPVSRSGGPAIDINLRGTKLKLHFPSGGRHGS